MAGITRDEIPLLTAGDDDLAAISRERVLSLSVAEMRSVREFFQKENRNPTLIELETIAQTWSEHCKHKIFRGTIRYNREIIPGLLAGTIARATKELNREWCVSVFKDNAGIIRFDEQYDVAFKVETHNHPSALEPYGGAGTGIGGVIRDILGVGLGAKPIFNTDVFCFAEGGNPADTVPDNVMHPRRIMKGVVSGVRDYGNRMGIPTISGGVCFHNDFLCNPLVYCGTAGIIPRGHEEKKAHPGDYIVAVGGKTGRDGIHGATFSSLELTAASDVSAVQIGNPIEEKKVAVALLTCRDERLYHSVTDCGAGGFSSAVGEMAEGLGADVWLEKAPLKYEGLKPWEIWISEAQERMVLAVPPENFSRLEEIFDDENVEVSIIGEFTSTGRLRLYYHKVLEGDLDLVFLHDGLPAIDLSCSWNEPTPQEPRFSSIPSLDKTLPGILAMPDVGSKEWIIRQYDHEVQGATVIKPLQGVSMDGPGDASAVSPVPGSYRGLVVSHGINVHYGLIDPYWMAACVIEEALRNIVAAGGDPRYTALLDNFCWGDPKDSLALAGLVRACKACYDYATAYGTPFISGKDSLNNTYRDSGSGKLRSIPPTLLISALSVVSDIRKLVTMDFKQPEDLVYLIGATYREMGGSQYYQYMKKTGGKVPRVNKERSCATLHRVADSISAGLVTACHDCSDGGIGVAIAEMAFSGGFGADIMMKDIPAGDDGLRPDELLFSESQSRFIVTLRPENKEKFQQMLGDLPSACAGRVTDRSTLIVRDNNDRVVIDMPLHTLKSAWKNSLRLDAFRGSEQGEE